MTVDPRHPDQVEGVPDDPIGTAYIADHLPDAEHDRVMRPGKYEDGTASMDEFLAPFRAVKS